MSHLETDPEVQALVAFAEGRGWTAEWYRSNPQQLAGFVWNAHKPHPERNYATVEELQNIWAWRKSAGLEPS